MSKKKGYVILDTETTGFRNMDDVIQFSCIVLDNDLRLKSFTNRYLNTGMKIPPDAYAVHHIDNATLLEKSQGADMNSIKGLVKGLCEEYIVIGHNVDFDLRMLNQNLDRKCRMTLDMSRIEKIDTMKRYVDILKLPLANNKGTTGKYKFPKLGELLEYCLEKQGRSIEEINKVYQSIFKVEGDFHNSLYDCYCTYYCFKCLR